MAFARIFYLILMTALSIFFRAPEEVCLFFLLNVSIWIFCRISLKELLISLRRYAPFFLFIALSYALFGESDEDFLTVNSWLPGLSITSLLLGVTMALRIYNIIIASLIVRKSGEPGELYSGMRKIGIPDAVALPFEVVSSLMERKLSAEGGSLKKRGGLSLLLKGDVSWLVSYVAESFVESKRIIKERNPLIKDRELFDLIVISSISFLIVSIRMIKILPGIPFAPGHKSIIIIPFYILAGELSAGRWGSTKTGITVGIISFMMGWGKFGIFELLKHISPGLFVDISLPVIKRFFMERRVLVYSALGIMVSIFRFTTILSVTVLTSPPWNAYYILLFVLASHVIIGAMSGLITYPLMRAADLLREKISKMEDQG